VRELKALANQYFISFWGARQLGTSLEPTERGWCPISSSHLRFHLLTSARVSYTGVGDPFIALLVYTMLDLHHVTGDAKFIWVHLQYQTCWHSELLIDGGFMYASIHRMLSTLFAWDWSTASIITSSRPCLLGYFAIQLSVLACRLSHCTLCDLCSLFRE